MKIWKERDEKLKTWVHRADFTVRGKRYKPKAFTKEDLEALIIQIKSNAIKAKAGLKPTVPAVTLGELVKEHIRDFDLSIEYYRRGKVVLEMFRDHIGEDMPVEKLLTADLRSYIRLRRSQNPKLQNSSINKDITFLSKLFSMAGEYFRELADWQPPKLPWEAESTKRKDRIIYEEEAATLLAYLRDPQIHKGEKPDSPTIRGHYADMFELAMNTGLRWGELSRLEWPMIDLKAATINLPKRITKTDESRTVPLNATAITILKKRIDGLPRKNGHRPSIFVFPRSDGKGPMLYYYDRLRSIAKKLGLPFGREAGWTLHSTRHSVATRMLARTGDFSAVQAILGHSDSTMTARYSHPDQVRSKAAVDALLDAAPVKKSYTKKSNGSRGR